VVLLLEKATIRLALGDAQTAVKLLRRSRDQLDENFDYDTTNFIEGFSSLIRDDTVIAYSGADYEHVMVRVMLALADLIEGGGDAYAYAVQVGEKQEQIIGSPLGELKGEKGYKPREGYRRVGFGAYIQGLIREDSLALDEAGKAYERALSFAGGDNQLYQVALDRARTSVPATEGNGVLHVFYLAGQGPYLVETRANPTSDAIRLAGWILLILNNNVAVVTQAPVPVPEVAVKDPAPGPITVSAEDGASASTITALDVNRIAVEQNEANRPWLVARALARRAIKAVGSKAVGKAVGSTTKGNSGELIGNLVTIATSVATTATENADTRNWSTLPAQIQAARLELPAGVHEIDFGGRVTRKVRIAAGHPSYVLVFGQSASAAPKVVIDRYSVADD